MQNTQNQHILLFRVHDQHVSAMLLQPFGIKKSNSQRDIWKEKLSSVNYLVNNRIANK